MVLVPGGRIGAFGDEGADEMLEMLATYVDEILEAIKGDTEQSRIVT